MGEIAPCLRLWDLVSDGVILVDRSGVVVWHNRLARALLGNPDQLRGRPIGDWLGPADRLDQLIKEGLPTMMAALPVTVTPILGDEDLMATSSESCVPANLRAMVLKRFPQAAPTSFEFSYGFAARDPVTRLLNRDAIVEKVDQHARGTQSFALACIDVDQFSRINEAHGYASGDVLLRDIAQRLLGALPSASLARLSGGRFAALILADDPEAAAHGMNGAVRQAMAAPFSIFGADRVLSACIGIAIGPVDSAINIDLIAAAELATRAALLEGSGSTRWFEPEMSHRHREQLSLEADLQAALRSGELSLYYQPKIRWPTRELVGFEALCRWNHPIKGPVPPTRFIPVAERSGTIVPLGNWVVREACRQLAEWRDQGYRLVPVAVNVSPNQLLAQPISELLAPMEEFGITADWLEIEITESALMDNMGSVARGIEDLRRAGVHLVIDDFGTGHSSLGNLRRLPITAFKIDRSFVVDVETSREARDIVATIIAMARTLSLEVVAEGVETEAQARHLFASGADVMQGYLFAYPIPADLVRRDWFERAPHGAGA